MGAACSVAPAETKVETVNIRPENFSDNYKETSCKNGEHLNHTDSNRQQEADQNVKSDSVFTTVPSIHCEEYNMKEENTVILSDVGSDDVVDPSLNIEDTERKIQRSRRTSKMENEAVTKQKLLRRMQSHDQEKEQEQDVCVGVSPTAADETIDPSLKINEVEERLVRTRRVSHNSYQQRLSLKKENLKKKTSLEEKSDNKGEGS